VQTTMISRVLADDVDDRHARSARVVQVRETVGEARAEVQQRACGFARHARIAVGRAGDDAFEEPEHATHAGLAVERRDEMHLGGAGIREADVDAAINQRREQTLGSVHRALGICKEAIECTGRSNGMKSSRLWRSLPTELRAMAKYDYDLFVLG